MLGGFSPMQIDMNLADLVLWGIQWRPAPVRRP